MSRQIDTSKKLSEEDVEYLKQRGMLDVVRLNAEQFGQEYDIPDVVDPTAPPSLLQFDESRLPEHVKPVEEMTVEELKAELKARDVPVSGDKAELQARLVEARG